LVPRKDRKAGSMQLAPSHKISRSFPSISPPVADSGKSSSPILVPGQGDQLLMLLEASARETAVLRKYDSFAMWHANAALWPNTASSTTGLRERTASKKVHRCGFMSS